MDKLYSLRGIYGKLLVEYGNKYKNIVVLDADLAKSTKTELFKKAFPDRFFDIGIAEADMMVTGAGLASTGKNVFCSTFAIFATGRAWEQIRNSIAYPEWAVKIIATHGGISVGEDGASHQALEDIALMKVIPDMTVIVPSCPIMLEYIMEDIIKYDKYLYMRLPRSNVHKIYKDNEIFEIGKGKTIKKGKDITIIANGLMVHRAMNTIKRFESMGIDVGLIDMFTVKPIDRDLIIETSKNTKAFLVCEEHQKTGGLADSVSRIIVENHLIPIERIGIDDVFGESATSDELFVKYHLDEESIIKKGKELYDRI